MALEGKEGKVSSSFRDPSGFLFSKDGVLYRQINLYYKQDYDCLMGSGLYKSLVDEGLLIGHQEVDIKSDSPQQAYKTIKPQIIPFISYPYEWCFSQLKDAALATLKIQKKSLEFGISLKDASMYNIQFYKGRPIFIDTLSFEKYSCGQPWVAYRQFCQHFLAPLALMCYKDSRLSQLLRIYIDGIPLDLASSLLPFSSRLNFSLLSHIHLHAKSQQHFASRPLNVESHKIGHLSYLAIIDNLEGAIKGLRWHKNNTEWADYYEQTNYSPTALEYKKQVIAEFLDIIRPANVWDLGANLGLFSRIASNRGIPTVAFDIDPVAVENNYLEASIKKEINILPLILDLTNPSPAIGWANQERNSLVERAPADMAFALALIHHLAISNNLPFCEIGLFLEKICKSLIIEFVPKEDSQVQRLLRSRKDIFPDYTQEAFESAFQQYFLIKKRLAVKDSLRWLYLMARRC